MVICFLRSSALGSFDFCQQRFFIEYNLGIRGKSGKKACLGTIVHRAMETIAKQKYHKQNDKKFFDDEDFGRIDVDDSNFDKFTEFAFNYYSEIEDHHDWTSSDLKTCKKWVWKALEYGNGIHHPWNKTIIEPEKFFDFEIEEEWGRYSYQIQNKTIEGKLRFMGTVDLITDEGNDCYLVTDYKGLPLDTPIPTLDGWKTMEELNLGDYIFDEFGKKTQVTGKSQIKNKDCYEIIFDDTSIVIADEEHLWKLSDKSIVNTKELRPGDKINIAKKIITEDVELPIDPYVLGIWLGDGRNRNAEVSSSDPFVFEEIQKRGYKIGHNLGRSEKLCKQRTVYNLTPKLRKLNLLHNKHIPKIYLRSSCSQRLELLKGLMDSDGSVNELRKQCVFCNCNKNLSDDVKELLLSLGQRPLQSHVFNHQFGRPISVYPISFRPIDINPFYLPRKVNQVNPNWGSGKSDKRSIKKINYIGIKQTQCIMVDSETNTYLCTSNMIPTHNTGKMYDWGKDKEKTVESLQTDQQLQFYYYALKKLYPDKHILMSLFFINHGSFSVIFDESDIPRIELELKRKIQTIRNTKVPRLLSYDQSHWKCRRLCENFSKPDETGECFCSKIHNSVKKKGCEQTIHEFGDVKKICEYGSGGGKVVT